MASAFSTSRAGTSQSQSWNRYSYVRNNPLNLVDPSGLAAKGDIVFFNWSLKHTSTWPRHAAVVTQVDESGTPTRAFGAWGDSVTFHEVDLTTHQGGIQEFMIGTGDMSELNQVSVDALTAAWSGKSVAPDWDGSQGLVCVDIATDDAGLGGQVLREAMATDVEQHPDTYEPIPLEGGGEKRADPSNRETYRVNPWLQQFFQNTNRYDSLR